ncbi:MAG: transcriptional repressor [Eubacteriales bacterium]|nr:transcriptional repressor [Eubacteriales bacterium]
MRYSKQREAINTYLQGTTCHPTAEEVYEQVKHEIHDISLATVYRNLKQLQELNLIKRLDTGEGEARFDADLSDHSHFLCERCGNVYDLFDELVAPEDIADKLGKGFTVGRKMIYAYGVCDKCNK